MGIFFAILALLWLLREPNFIKGWASIFSADGDDQRYIGYFKLSATDVAHGSLNVSKATSTKSFVSLTGTS